MAVRVFLVEAFKIPSASMEGTLLVGDFLLVNRFAYGAEIPGGGMSTPALTEPHRGDVVVLRPPHDPQRSYVKRLMGMAGDTLEMRSKVLYVNGVALDEPYTEHRDLQGDAVHPMMRWQDEYVLRNEGDTQVRYRPTRDNWGPLVVPEGQLFLLGDNRDNSEDSRYWGFAPRSTLTGRPWRVYFSVDRSSGEGESWLRQVRWSRIGGLIR